MIQIEAFKIKKDLTYALLISVGIHIFGMSVFTIVVPGGITPSHSSTRIDFLGPILRKTAFDIMLEHSTPPVTTAYRDADISTETKALEISLPKTDPDVQVFPKLFEAHMDILMRDFLADYKVVPDLMFDAAESEGIYTRKVLYRPASPFIMKGLYGDKERFAVRIKTLVDAEGNVKKAELITTTGYPKLDIIISGFVKSWIFEPLQREPKIDEWQEIEFVLKAVR